MDAEPRGPRLRYDRAMRRRRRARTANLGCRLPDRHE